MNSARRTSPALRLTIRPDGTFVVETPGGAAGTGGSPGKSGAGAPFDRFAGTGSNAGFGRLIGWGSGPEEAAARAASITLQEIEQAGITRAVAEYWLSFYTNAVANGQGGAAAPQRVILMQRVLQLLGG